MPIQWPKIWRNRIVARYRALLRNEFDTAYSRDLHKWLLVAPIVGIVTGAVITCIAEVVLRLVWPWVLALYRSNPWTIVPGLLAGFAITGVIMQFFTPDPNEHSTEEIIEAYHKHHGDVDLRPFVPKLVAAITTVGSGGSAALEGPSIYGGGAVGSWLWTKLRGIGMGPRDRKIMLICGAAAGMAAVFRAPLTGLVFALEMPYKDDLAHEALLPSLISSVVAYVTLISFLGPGTLFNFSQSESFAGQSLIWAAILGAGCGLVTLVFDTAFRRARAWFLTVGLPHWMKMALGGLLTGFCGLAFVMIYHDGLIPLGPNYEAVGYILSSQHASSELAVFGIFKLAATLFSLASGGVSAMFVPLFLCGGSLGIAFAQSVVHSPSTDLYAAVGMAAFLAGGYKTPLTAVIFVAEASGGHAYIIPTLIGAAVAYAVSGETSVSSAQHLHETIRIHELRRIPVSEIMQREMLSVAPDITLRKFGELARAFHWHANFPVLENGILLGAISERDVAGVDQAKWDQTTVSEFMSADIMRIIPECDIMEAARLLVAQKPQDTLFVTSPTGNLVGIVTKTDILSALDNRDRLAPAWSKS